MGPNLKIVFNHLQESDSKGHFPRREIEELKRWRNLIARTRGLHPCTLRQIGQCMQRARVDCSIRVARRSVVGISNANPEKGLQSKPQQHQDRHVFSGILDWDQLQFCNTLLPG